MATHDDLPGTPRLLRAINDRAALRLLLEHGRLSRTELGALTGLSKPTASQMLTRLEAAGLVLPVEGTATGGPGRVAQLYELNPTAGFALAVDVTPGSTRAVVVDLLGNHVGDADLPRTGDDAVDLFRRARERALAAAGVGATDITHTVVALPGAYDNATRTLRHARHLPGWHRDGVFAELGELLEGRVEFENDVNLLALAELHQGASVGTGTSVLLWSASGIGAAVVVGGRLHRGATGSAGELGYLPVPGAPLVREVNQDTGGFEQSVGEPGLLELARRHGVPGGSPEQVVAAAPPGGEFLTELATRYATGIAAVVAVLDPEVVVFSGPVAEAGDEVLRALVEREVAALAMRPVPVRLGTILHDPVLTGATHVAVTRLRDNVFDSAGAPDARSGERTAGS